jgi:hypothetical protein
VLPAKTRDRDLLYWRRDESCLVPFVSCFGACGLGQTILYTFSIDRSTSSPFYDSFTNRSETQRDTHRQAARPSISGLRQPTSAPPLSAVHLSPTIPSFSPRIRQTSLRAELIRPVSLKTAPVGEDGLPNPLPSCMVSTLFSGAHGAPVRARAADTEHGLDLFSPLALPSDEWEVIPLKEADPFAFPLPPTLEDMRRMEWDHRQEGLAPPVPAKAATPVRAPSAHVLVAEEAGQEVSGWYQNKGFTEQDTKPAFRAKMPIMAEFVTACLLKVAQSCSRTQSVIYINESCTTFSSFFTFRATARQSSAATASVVERITMILTATSLSPSVPLLAIWYARRLAVEVRRSEEVGSTREFADLLFAGGPVSHDELAMRLFVTGLMLSDAWLDDHSFAVKTWLVELLVP